MPDYQSFVTFYKSQYRINSFSEATQHTRFS